MARIQLEDSIVSAIAKMADGNLGAVSVCAEFMKKAPKIDPDAELEGIWPILFMDTLGIYGPRIWLLYKNVCGQDLVKMLACLRACQLGIIGEAEVHTAIDGLAPLDVDGVLARVQAELPNFGQQAGE